MCLRDVGCICFTNTRKKDPEHTRSPLCPQQRGSDDLSQQGLGMTNEADTISISNYDPMSVSSFNCDREKAMMISLRQLLETTPPGQLAMSCFKSLYRFVFSLLSVFV